MSDTIQHPDLCQYPGCTQPRLRLQNYCLLHNSTHASDQPLDEPFSDFWEDAKVPDQPEDATLSDDQKRRSAIGKIVTSNLSPLGKLEAIDTLFMEQQAKAVQAARIDELKQLSAIAHEHHDYLLPRAAILDRIRTLQATQPPAADTTKEANNE